MTQEEYEVLERCATKCVRKLIARGVPKEEAIRRASEMAVAAAKLKYPGGLGGIPVTPTPLDTLAQESKAAADIAVIKTVREAVSPWLWLASLAGFGMAVMNTRRIAKMYRGWREKKGGKKR
ncbi:MAG: hypothetical protein ACREI9_08970 [Nitrospiraceae bacterium]